MIAFHYPPCDGSSGLQRTLAFTRYLDQYGWEPALLTVSAGAYEKISSSLLDAVPDGMPIKRALALDAARHLSLWNRYPTALAIPDRWVSWRYTGPRAALKLIRQFKPDAMWSTFPIATAHLVAASVARKTGLPWIADMRDPMVELDPYSGIEYPENQDIRESRLKIENDIMELAAKVVFCTDGSRSICLDRYGADCSSRFTVIPNGFDEDAFVRAESRARGPDSGKEPGFNIVHSGTVYPGSDRGPEALFEALRQLREDGELPRRFRLVLRASGHDDYLRNLIVRFDISTLVELAPPVPYESALVEMLESDALLVMQGHASNPAIPAKIYEYFRARKPILGLLHPAGDTAELLRSLDAGLLAPLDDAEKISNTLKELFHGVASGRCLSLAENELRRYSRQHQTRELARVLDSIATS